MICALAGTENFARQLAERLDDRLLALEQRRFPDRESYLRLTGGVEGANIVFACTLNDPDQKALPLLFAAATARELGARCVGLVAPYLGYMRQDRRFKDGEAITSTHFAALLSQSFDWLVTVDAHLHRRASLAEIYSIPATNVSSGPAIAAWIAANVPRPLVIGPDAESEQWAAQVARDCAAPYAVMSKTRLGDREVRIEAPDLSQWRDRTPVLLDDIISSARTMAFAARQIQAAGFAPPVCIGVHAIFSSGATSTLHAAGVRQIVTANTVPHETNAMDVSSLVAVAVKERLNGFGRS